MLLHLPTPKITFFEINVIRRRTLTTFAFVFDYIMQLYSLEEDKTVGSLGFTKVKLIADGAAAFTREMGMSTTWGSERGFGERSWRYSAVFNDMKIEKLFIEGGTGAPVQNSGPDPFEVSDADTMLQYLKDTAEQKSEL